MTEGTPLPEVSKETGVIRGKFHPLWLLLKTLVSLGLIAVVFWKLDLASVWEKTRQLSGVLILSIALMFVAQVYFAAWRWWVILRHHHLKTSLSSAVGICFIGAFFNQLLPSSIGGDVARAWYVYRSGEGRKISAITVLSDRIYGMLTLVGLAVVSFPVLVYFSVAREALVGVGVLIVGSSSALLAAFWLDRLPGWMQRWPAIRHLGSLSEATRAITADRRAVVPLLGLSMLIHGITAAAILILLAAIAHQSNLLLYAALVPAIMLMAMIPISIAGWGVRESTMIYGLGLAKVSPEAALVVSILVGLSLAAVGVLGGLMWVIQINRDRPRELVA
jgi:uncharacterized membrane protein YbhN (UPF0104 family)